MNPKQKSTRPEEIGAKSEKISLNNFNVMKLYKEKKLQTLIKEFCKNTKLYGFNYLTEPKRFKVEKCFWIIFIVISFCICLNLLIRLWFSWNQNSIIILNQNPKSISQIPFPAITVCPEIKVRQSIYNFTDYYHKVLASNSNLTSAELQIFSDTSLVCDNHLHTTGNKTRNSEVIEHLRNIAPPLEEIFLGCKWTGLNKTCEDLFTSVLTEDGLCFTFNMLAKQEIFNNNVHLQNDDHNDEQYSDGWTLEGGYFKNSVKDTFPGRTATSGPRGGLFMLLKANEEDFDYICRGPVQGFKVLLHHPSEMPKIGHHYFRGPINQELLVTVKPKFITSNSDLKTYDPDERQCYFDGERSLKFFRNYTQANCRTECLTNYTLLKCDCAAFYMPREESTSICGSGSNICVFEAEQELLEQNVESHVCGCLPACTSLTYHARITQADFNAPKVLQAFKSDVNEFSKIHMTRIVVFFDDLQFEASLRTKFGISFTEFLAQCGGILMLFTGFSFLSIAEIVYFLSLRLICNVKKYGKDQWSGSSKSSAISLNKQ